MMVWSVWYGIGVSERFMQSNCDSKKHAMQTTISGLEVRQIELTHTPMEAMHEQVAKPT